jgi:uncharacterized protein YjbI with pentapeptide repeats
MGSVRRRWRSAAHVLATVSVVLLMVAVLSWDRLARLAAHIPLVPLVFVIMSMGFAVAADQLYRRTRLERQRRSAPRIRWWWVVLAFAAVLVAVWATTALLMPQTLDVQPGSERVKQRIDVVRTALAAGAGMGAAITVLLAFRRQHHHEEATERADHDASERRITELYTKAVEQLGSPQAPVRLGGLYALERLGQAVTDHRQTIVDVICAYLRMPYTPLADPHPSEERQGRWLPHAVSRFRQASHAFIRGKADNQQRQELQVRQAAQRILAAHLRDRRPQDKRDTTPADDRFWEGMRLDLSHAALINWNFRDCHVAVASFSQATFTGLAWFKGATFPGPVWFDGATFTGEAGFDGATFTGEARFNGTTFTGPAAFVSATFFGRALFERVTFKDDAYFHVTAFNDTAWFDGATFTGEAGFDGAHFTGEARFNGTTFTGEARFDGAAFARPARFDRARARLTTPEGTSLTHRWPTSWDLRPTAGGWGIPRKT